MVERRKIIMIHPEIISPAVIESKIYIIRGIQVMLDRDLAFLYGVETRLLNQAVKRNMERFPEMFCFQLSDEEFENWRSQFVISKEDRVGLRRAPFVFTEQGVAMLSAILKSEIAIQVSIHIMNAFVQMRKTVLSHTRLFDRMNTLESRQKGTDQKVEKVLKLIGTKELEPLQGIFYNGQVFDAYEFVSELIRSAKKSLVLIDNYVDDTVLTHFSKKKKNVQLVIYTKSISRQLALDVEKFNSQYPGVKVIKFKEAHDRFLIIDNKTVYHIGASLKDLGRKWFAFSKLDIRAFDMLKRLPGDV